MKVETATLTGPALDWAVAKCEGLTVYKDAMLGGLVKHGWWVSGMSIDPNTWHPLAMFEPSTDWAQGGPIIDREFITVGPYHGDGGKPTGVFQAYMGWDDDTFDPLFQADGPTPLIAAMRCFVASKLGNDVEVPDELA